MRLIDADELSMSKFHPVPYTHITPKDADAESYKWGWNDAVDAIMSEAPTIDPVKHGRWLRTNYTDYDDTWECSECGATWTFLEGTPKDNEANYCPHCGTKMDGGEE